MSVVLYMQYLYHIYAVPVVLKTCAEVIELHGIVDGIYRLSGVASNIQRLRFLAHYLFDGRFDAIW